MGFEAECARRGRSGSATASASLRCNTSRRCTGHIGECAMHSLYYTPVEGRSTHDVTQRSKCDQDPIACAVDCRDVRRSRGFSHQPVGPSEARLRMQPKRVTVPNLETLLAVTLPTASHESSRPQIRSPASCLSERNNNAMSAAPSAASMRTHFASPSRRSCVRCCAQGRSSMSVAPSGRPAPGARAELGPANVANELSKSQEDLVAGARSACVADATQRRHLGNAMRLVRT